MADRIKCPTCGNYLSFYNAGRSTGHKNQPYTKTEYECRTDGTWVTVEVPVENKE